MTRQVFEAWATSHGWTQDPWRLRIAHSSSEADVMTFWKPDK